MSELISREALVTEYKRFSDEYRSKHTNAFSAAATGIDRCIFALEHAPTVEAVQVTRCKDCFNRELCCSNVNTKDGNGFCHKGARMDADAPERAGEATP
jgi:hypothetical protein